MKTKHISNFILIILLLPVILFGQTEWHVIRLDENVSFSFPSEYKRSDTLGQNNFLSTTNVGYLQVVKIPQPQAQISNEKDLVEYYKAFQKLTIAQSNGNLISNYAVEMSDLYARVFEFENYWNDTLQIETNMIVLINHSMYCFNYAYLKHKREHAQNEKKAFFAAVTTYNVDFVHQLTIQNSNDRTGKSIGYILPYIAIGALVLVATLWVWKNIIK